MEWLARWSFRHRRLVVVLWLVAVAGIFGLGRLVPATYGYGESVPGTESHQAAALLQRQFPDQPGEVDTIVWEVSRGTVRDPAVRERMGRMLDDVRRRPHVIGVQSPYDPAGAQAISQDGRIAFALVNFDRGGDELDKEVVTDVIDTARGYSDDTVTVSLSGYAVKEATMTFDTSISELVGVLAASIVLWLAFGSLLSVSLPLITAIASVIPAVALIGIVSRVLTVPSFAASLTILLNLGVGIDYALFLVTRQRRGLRRGESVEDALVGTLRTAGRSVLFAGAVVCVALLGLFTLRVDYLSGMAASAAIGIAFTVVAALTLLPALLAIFGQRVFSRRDRRRAATDPCRRTATAPAGGGGPASSSGARSGSRCSASRSAPRWRHRSSACGWASPTRATTRSARPPGPRTTPSRKASGQASTPRCSSWCRAMGRSRTTRSRRSARR
ncbi:MMPL family transporter [Actinoplanes sp. NPDC049802]|uniref:MMPL family transporter n=1 Tax=Actinoplanes sp. NPDC049802 TaxID=3154742 RepID=UPI0033D94F0A